MFWAYHCVSPGLDKITKTIISDSPLNLRGDAAYFLLINFDQMLYRVEQPVAPLGDWGSHSIIYSDTSKLYTQERIQGIFDVIMRGLEKEKPDDLGYSAHQIMKSIDIGWVNLIPFALWE
jgi:hypothetical protein